MNRLRVIIGISAFSLLVLALPAIATAQYYPSNDPYGRNGGYNDPYGRNGGYNDPYGRNNGGYGNNNTKSIVRNLKSRTRELTRQIDRELDHGRYDGSQREDYINDAADRFRDAVNDLNNNSRQDSNEIRRVQQAGSQLDGAIRRSRLSYNVQNLWASIRNDLQQLGGNGYYDNNNRNNRNNRNGYPQGNTQRNLPSWWPF
ncbi:MAG: hypothetical protein WKF34_01890 [Pyrinomonadaceae bacterium]